MTRSSKRAPTAISTSQCCIAMFASYVPCMPSMPRNCGSDAGNAPRPISVLVNGKPGRCTSCVSSWLAFGPELITPPPV